MRIAVECGVVFSGALNCYHVHASEYVQSTRQVTVLDKNDGNNQSVNTKHTRHNDYIVTWHVLTAENGADQVVMWCDTRNDVFHDGLVIDDTHGSNTDARFGRAIRST